MRAASLTDGPLLASRRVVPASAAASARRSTVAHRRIHNFRLIFRHPFRNCKTTAPRTHRSFGEGDTQRLEAP
ncbi:hypothetical protein WL80_20840 [Burkholderia ubonensis]|nr:hypothetical protein WL80_20840 [Burkholderia ubonensis]